MNLKRKIDANNRGKICIILLIGIMLVALVVNIIYYSFTRSKFRYDTPLAVCESSLPEKCKILSLIEADSVAWVVYEESKNHSVWALTIKDEKGWKAFAIEPQFRTISSDQCDLVLYQIENTTVLAFSVEYDTSQTQPQIKHTLSKPIQIQTYEKEDCIELFGFFEFETVIPDDYVLEIGNETFSGLSIE